MTTKIYMNRWFSTVYHYINMIRTNPDGMSFEFHNTHPSRNHMSLLSSDHPGTEPPLTGKAYARFCADYCREHGIDVFIPRLNMEDIVRHIHLFDEIGTRVMACRETELMDAMTEKNRFYELIRDKGLLAIPEYRVVHTAAGFKEAYEELAAKGKRVCFKPVKGEGGMGFRIIASELDPLAELYGYVTLSTTFQRAYETLSLVESFEELMVMEYLEGPEYSIDCLANAEGELITAIPRRKSEGRVYLLEELPELMELAQRVASELRLPYVYNIQIRYSEGVPKLLEINPRMSGGLYLTALTGINIPYLAVRAVLGLPIEPPKPVYGIKASYVEQAVLLKS